MINESILRQWWQVFKDGCELVEIRILGKFTYSAYYRNVEKLIVDLPPYEDMPDEQIYFTLNTINDGCYGRQQCEQVVKSPKSTTGDPDIIRRKWVMIDFDPVRTVGVNATDAEFELARLKAQQVYLFLKGQGFAEPVICKSGNGWHVLYRVDMENTDAVTETIKGFLQAVAVMFSDEAVDIDQKVFNASRICKLYGTTAKKGANIAERPWRAATIEYVPQAIGVNGIELFQKIASLMPKEEPQQQSQWRGSRGEKFDVEGFLREHGVGFKRVAIAGGVKYVLDECIFDHNHKAPDAAVFQKDTGEIGYICFHNHCSGYTWRDVRLKLDPTAYDPKPQPYPQPMQYQRLPQAILPQKEEPKFDLGAEGVATRWKTMKSIRKVNILDIPHFLTGFTEIDRYMKGLFEGDVTVLSGLNSSGKSSWLNTLILNIMEQGVKVAMWSGELPDFLLKSWIQMVAAGREYLKADPRGYWYVPDMVASRMDEWMNDKLLIFDNEYPSVFSLLMNDMEQLAQQGVKMFVLDNLMAMTNDADEGTENQRQSALMKRVKTFAQSKRVHVLIVAHPRKVTTFLRKNDISGTADITNLASNVLIAHRVNNDFKKMGGEFFGQAVITNFFEYSNVIEITKNRLMGAQDLLCGMYYEIESRRFLNQQNEARHYGWCDAKQTNMFEQQAPSLYPQPPSNDMPFAPQQESDLPF